MKATFLGTGTSVGVPCIGCDCPVCLSTNPRNRRRRTSLYVQTDEACLLIDTPPDFREQALAYGLQRIDAVCFTHAHADHIFGFDDIRRFNTIQDCVIPAYAGPETIVDLRRIFDYVGTDKVSGFYRPRIRFEAVSESFSVGNITVTPVPVEHGTSETVGYLLDAAGVRLAYVPDCHAMSDAAIATCAGVDVMVLDALRDRPHRSHLTVTDSVALLQQIGAAQSYLIHLCHEVDHDEVQSRLPDGMDVAYDGLRIDLT